MAESPDIHTETLAETENYMVYAADEPDGEPTWHVELGNVTLHFFREAQPSLLDEPMGFELPALSLLAEPKRSGPSTDGGGSATLRVPGQGSHGS